mgnify:CR=1 FL=1
MALRRIVTEVPWLPHGTLHSDRRPRNRWFHRVGWVSTKTDLMISLTIPMTLRAFAALSGFFFVSPVTPAIVQEVAPLVTPAPVKVQPLAEVISRGEGDWNAVNRGIAGDTPGGLQGLLGITCESLLIADLINLQNQRKIYAVGRYQFIPQHSLDCDQTCQGCDA